MLLKETPSGGGLYIIRLSDKHWYGGRTVSFYKRWSTHLHYLRAGTHNNPHMQRVFNKYHRFDPTVVAIIEDESALHAAEQAWLDENFGKPGCVNLNPLADGCFEGSVWVNDGTINRRVVPEETEPLLAAGWLLGRKPHPEGWVNVNKGRPASPAQLDAAKIAGEKRRGRTRPPEQVAATAAGNLGRKNTPESLANMKAAGELRRGRKRDPAAVEATANANRGKQHSPEIIAKMARAKAKPVNGVMPPEGITSSDFEMVLAFPPDGDITVADLRNEFSHLTKGSVRQRLTRCKSAELVESIAHGVYRLTDKALVFLSAVGSW